MSKKHALFSDDRHLLIEVGEALYGPPWAALVAQETGTARPMLSMMQHGRRPVSWRVWGPLAALMDRRVVMLSQLAARPDPGKEGHGEGGSGKEGHLAEAGALLYGPSWKQPMADDLVELLPELFRSESDRPYGPGMVTHPQRKIAAYARGDRPVPDEFWHALRQIAARRVVQLRRLLPQVRKKAQDSQG